MALALVGKSSSKNKNIEFNKPTLSKEELQRVLDCLAEDKLFTGGIVEEFEKEFKSTFGRKNAISVNSLTSAYHLALSAIGIKESDTIILSTIAPLCALDAILMLKAKPVPVDIGKNSFHISAEDLERKIAENDPKAILMDHSFGCLFDSKNYTLGDIPLIEDFSEALGANSDTISVGRQGIISVCGFSENHIITTGNGAIIVTENDKLASIIRSYKTGGTGKRNPTEPKYDYNLIDFQAAIGIEQLSKLGVLNERKKKIASVFLQSVMASQHETYFKNAKEDQFNRFPVLFGRPFEEVQRYFKSIHIGIEKITSEPIHHILGYANSEFPNGERLFQKGHCLPIYPNLTRDNINRISSSIRGIF